MSVNKIRKLLFALLFGGFFTAPLFATTPFSVNVQTIAAVRPTQNVTVEFRLQNCTGGQARVIATPTIIAQQVYDFKPNASGLATGVIYGNDEINCGGFTNSYYTVVYVVNGIPVQPSYSYVILSANGTFDPSVTNPISSTPVVYPPTGDNTYLRLDASNSGTAAPPVVIATKPSTFTAFDTFGSINGILRPDACGLTPSPSWCSGTTADAWINAAVTRACSTGSHVVDARGFGLSTQTIASKIDVGSSSCSIALILDAVTTYQCTITNSTVCVNVHAGSSIWADGTGTVNPTAGLTLVSSSIVQALVSYTNDGGTGSHNGLYLSNLFLNCGAASSTVTDACLAVPNAIQPTLLVDINISAPTGAPGFKAYATGTGQGQLLTDILVINMVVDGVHRTGSIPAVVGCFATNSLTPIACNGAGPVIFKGGDLVHPGYSQAIAGGTSGQTALYVEGSAGTGQNTVAVFVDGTHFESYNTAASAGAGWNGNGDIDAQCNSCSNLVMENTTHSAANSSTGYAILNVTNAISGTPRQASLSTPVLANGPTNLVVNTVSGTTITNAQGSRLPYSYVQTGTYQQFWDSVAGQMYWGTGGLTSSLPVNANGGVVLGGSITPSVAAGQQAGTAALPFSKVCVGSAANDSSCISGTFTANRSLTLPDANVVLPASFPAKYSQSLTPAAATTSQCVEQTFTVTGLATGQELSVSPPSSLGAHVWISYARVSSSNTAAISFCADATGGTPASGTYVFLAF